jgi:hypothetical protein
MGGSFTVKGYYCGGWDTDHQAVEQLETRILSEGFDDTKQVLFPSSNKKLIYLKKRNMNQRKN